MNFFHCDEKGMRFESATVPAAVIPDSALCGMMVFEIPATVPISRDGKASKTGISQKTCHKDLLFNAFGKKSADHFLIPYLFFCQPGIIIIVKNDKYYYGVFN
jgi:hypothetical protein